MGTEHAWASTPPDYALLPGETVLELLEARGITQSQLAERTGRPKKTINEIIKGKAAITPETALQFERVLGVPASFFNSLEQQYRATLARIAEREWLEGQIAWLKEIPVRALVKAGWIPEHKDKVDQIEAVLRFFGVASPDAWRDVWGGVRSAIAFRQSPTFESDFAAVAAWLRRGEIEAHGVRCDPYDASRFREALDDARTLTCEPPEVFCTELMRICAAAGVVVRFIPELPKLRVCGATRWLSPDKALIQLTLRYKTDDHLWFSFFHEAGHILLHGKRAVFVEGTAGGARNVAAAPDTATQEDEANRFARDILIPRDAYAAFVHRRDFREVAVRLFAREIGIAPGIVVGRLEFDKWVPYHTRLNHLKRHFEWSQGG